MSPDGEPSRPMPLAARALFALATLLIFAAALELALAAGGLGGTQRLLASRGFAHDTPYVRPDAEHPGGWLVEATGAGQEVLAIPPRGEPVRVLLFGGSNTAGWPTRVFERRLEAELPAPGFEVFNLGRAGYGSERVRILLEQALALQPDVVVIHAGHNELVECGFALELLHEWGSTTALRALDAAMRLRALSFAVDTLRESRGGGAAPAAPGHQERERLLAGMRFEETQVFYDQYRRNLEAMLETCRAAGVRVLLSTVIGNPFCAPKVSTPPSGLGADGERRLVELRARARPLLPERLVRGVLGRAPGERPLELDVSDWGHHLAEEQLQARLARKDVPPAPPMRAYLGALAQAPYWNAPNAWSPRAAQLMAEMSELHARRLEPGERDALRRAAALYDEALAIAPDHPDTLYEAGLCRYLLGEARGAELLHAAMAADRAPERGNAHTNGIVRALAAEREGDPGFRFVDLEALARERSPDGLVGYEVMMDHCHLHLMARTVVLDDQAPALAELARAALAAR